MSTAVGIIKKFVQTLVETKNVGTAAVDEAFKAVGAVNYEVFMNKFYKVRDNYLYSFQDFCEQECGIRINNTDTGAITGSDAGTSKTPKTSESIIPESAKAVELTSAQYNSFTKNGLTVNITYFNKTDTEAGEDFDYSSENYLAKQKLAVRALYNWWIPEALDLINESLGINFTDGRANTNEIDVVFYGNANGWNYHDGEALDVTRISYDMGRASRVTFMINADYLYNLTANDKNGTLPQNCYIYREDYYNAKAYTNYLDRLIAHALAEVALKANVAYVDELPMEIAEGLCALVDGYDDATTAHYNFVNFDNDTGGYGRLRYLAKNYSDGLPDGVSYNDKKTVLTVTNEFTGGTLDLTELESTVKTVKATALKKNIRILGNDNANSLAGGTGNDSLNGGKGNDSLNGGKGDDTLVGGAGKDVFIYTAGNDTVADYEAGDKISLGGSISKTAVSGSDVVFTVGKNTLTVKDAAGKTLTLINDKGKEYDTVVSSAKTLKITNKTSSPVTLAADIGKADASARTKAVKIVGNKFDNVILGGSKNDTVYGESGNDSIVGNAGNDNLYGGSGKDTLVGGAGNDYLVGGAGNHQLKGDKGNDTLTGGAGNDSLWGGAGNDVFIYSSGDGDDVIFGFDSKDTLTLDTFDFAATYKKDVLTLTFEDGSLTFKDSSTKTFHINDDTYKISGSKLVKK